jgi:hypothetical protein
LIKLTLPLFVQAACWGLLASSGLLIGALLATILAFAAGGVLAMLASP